MNNISESGAEMEKRAMGLIAAILVCCFLSGCWDRKELDEVSIVVGVGIDFDTEKNKVIIASQIVRPGQMKTSAKEGGGGGGGEKATVLTEMKEATVLGAIRGLVFKNGRKLDFTHNEVIIIGENAAKKGIAPLLDFFIRDPGPRPTQWVLAAAGEARKTLEAKPQLEKALATEIKNFVENWAVTSEINPVRLQDLTEALLSRTTAATLPIIKLSKSGAPKSLMMDGTAVFRKDKYSGKMGRKETRGLLWAAGKVKGGVIQLAAPGGGKIGIEIIHASGKIQPELNAHGMKVRIEVKLEGNVGNQMTAIDMSDPGGLTKLQKLAETAVKSEIMAAVKKAKELNADIFGLGESFRRKYPRQWRRMESKWNELFPKMEVSVNTKTVLRLTGETTKPLGMK